MTCHLNTYIIVLLHVIVMILGFDALSSVRSSEDCPLITSVATYNYSSYSQIGHTPQARKVDERKGHFRTQRCEL